MNSRQFLGFDYGRKWIGVAIGQEITRTASPLATLNQGKQGAHWQQIATMIQEWHPDAFVVGVPSYADGTEHPMAAEIRGFSRGLVKRFSLPIYCVDEQLTSYEAEGYQAQRVKAKNRQSHKEELHKLAASIILETFLSQLPSPP